MSDDKLIKLALGQPAIKPEDWPFVHEDGKDFVKFDQMLLSVDPLERTTLRVNFYFKGKDIWVLRVPHALPLSPDQPVSLTGLVGKTEFQITDA
jgi:hypothetical protein